MKELKGEKEFNYVLNAFLSAGRSITFLLKRNNSGNAQFEEWYGEKVVEMRESMLFSALKEARNYAQKEGYLRITEMHISGEEVSASIYGYVGPDIADAETFGDNLSGEDITIKGVSEITSRLGAEYRSQSLEEICEEYLEKLEEIVSEWEGVSSG